MKSLLAWIRSRQSRVSETPYNRTYLVLLARTVDILLAGWIWRDYDVTISAMTGLALRAATPPAWSILLGAFLEICQRNHCEQAVAADRERAQTALKLLGPP